MNKDEYSEIEKYMLTCMKDGAHDTFHIYRVLYTSLEIGRHYSIDKDVLIAAALLHDIGRDAQFKDCKINHAIYGSEIVFEYLIKKQWDEKKAKHVKDCISTHRFRNANPPKTIEAKILFDSDKIDVSGTIGIARTLAYKGIVSEPLYCIDNNGEVLNGETKNEVSFFQEYKFKLRNIYSMFYTKEAKEIAEKRQKASIDFYNNMYNEVYEIHKNGIKNLNDILG